MSTDHKKPLDGALFLASQIIVILITIPAFIPRPAQVIALIVVGWYFYRVIFTQTAGDFDNDLAVGSAIVFQYMVALDFALLTPPDELKDFDDEDRTRVTQRPFRKRVIWALRLYSNPRGIGWAHEPSHLSPRPSPSIPRSKFVFSRILLAAFCFLVACGTHLFDAAHADMAMAYGAPLHRRVLGVLSLGLGAVSVISGINATISAGIVGCGLSPPERWPLFFGSPLQVWSIRRFWRRFWHQLLRRHVLTCTSFILGCVFPANYVGTTGYKLARLYIAFGISGIVHIAGDTMATGKFSFKTFTFFMLQPFGITIEIVVANLWRRLQHGDESDGQKNVDINRAQQNGGKNGRALEEEPIPPVWIRCVGSVWVIIWMVWTAAYMVDALFTSRMLSSKLDLS